MGAVLDPVRGAQEPRLRSVPDYGVSAGDEAIELAALAGLDLDPWEQLVLGDMLGERADGKWASFHFGLVVPRQNGKGTILEARELAGMFLLGHDLIVHSAHEQTTATEHFLRLLSLIENVPEFDRRVQKVARGKGAEAIELRDGPRIFFRTRTQDGGRGLGGELVTLDEAMKLREESLAALLPLMAARSEFGNPQVVYSGSAVDAEKDEHGVAFARIREKALAGEDKFGLCEWSIEGDDPSEITSEMASDPELWAQANPGLGIRISEEYVADERGALDPRSFAVERLGVGAWPRTDGLSDVVIEPEKWAACRDEQSTPVDPVCLALDVSPDRSRGAIAAAGARRDGKIHGEIVEHQRGTAWMAGRTAEIVSAHSPRKVLLDASGPAGSLIPDLEQLGVNVTLVNAKELAQACGAFYDLVDENEFRHLGTAELSGAVKGAVKRPLGEAWAWSRKNSGVDISPVVALTLAVWGHTSTVSYSGPLLEIL